MNTIQLDFLVGGEQRDLLLAVLSEIGFDGFEEQEGGLSAFISASAFDEIKAKEVTDAFGLSFEKSEVEEQNWNAIWESSFQPVTIEDFCTVRADFHPADSSVKHELIITPQMSFGTGHHATTRMMLRAMKSLDFLGKRVLDFGTGTGVLAILAEKLGATKVLAIDNDAWSVANAMENCKRNQSESVSILLAHLEEVLPEQFDIVLANINRHVLLGTMKELFASLISGGKLVLSGILADDESIIENSAYAVGFQKQERLCEGNWLCIIFTVPEA
ncbi:MAG: 50S ribosomal protein L11 methyltransferase [Chitinophagaceae bacterium]